MSKISFNNFKAFGEKPQTFSNKPITLIYGPNSIGKSSLLHGLLYFFYIGKNGEISPKDTTFAGDKIDFGGFKNFIHNHKEDGKITYEFTYDDIDEISKMLNINLKEIKEINPYTQSLTKEIIEEKIAEYDKIHIIRFRDVLAHYETMKIMKQKNKKRFLGFIYMEGDNKEQEWTNIYKISLKSLFLGLLEYAQIEDIKKILGEKKIKNPFIKFMRKVKMINYFYEIKRYEEDLEILRKKGYGKIKEYFGSIDSEYLEIQKSNDEFIQFCLKYKVFKVERILETIQKIKNLTELEIFSFRTDVIDKKENNNRTLFKINNTKWFEIEYNGKINIFKDYLFGKNQLEFYPTHSGRHVTKLVYQNIFSQLLNMQNKYAPKLKQNIMFFIFDFYIYFSKFKTQYFSPLRYYPERKELIVKKDKEDRKHKKVSIGFIYLFIFGYLNNSHTSRRISKIFIPILIFIKLPIFKNNQMFIDLLNELPFVDIRQKDSITAEGIWNKLIQSEYGIEKLDKWFSDDTKLKSQYKIKTEEHKDTKELKFIDSRNNIEVTPRDMGLGISQVLPILVASQNFQDTTLFLEQPELHLHPAVQCELADEFIKSAKENGNKFYIETHSEHLLLRVMKRLRHSSEGKLKEDDPLYLTPEDICLLYVDNNGKSTYLKELELDKDGSLLDAWPNGFFEEGYKERFE